MPRNCYLCRKKANKTISLHRFPKEHHIRLKWLEACKLTEADDVSHIYICSCHFKDEEEIEKSLGSFAGKYIFRDAVPSLHLKYVKPKLHTNTVISDETKKPAPRTDADITSTTLLKETKSTVSNDIVNTNITNVSNTLSDANEIKIGNEVHKDIGFHTLRKRRFTKRHFVSELNVSDFATLRRTKRSIARLKYNDAKKQERIKELQRQKQALLKRNTYLEKMVKRLQQERLVSESVV